MVDRTVTLPRSVALILESEVARAHLSMTVLTTLLRSGSLNGEEASLAEMLGYIEDGLERCVNQIDRFVHGRDDEASHA